MILVLVDVIVDNSIVDDDFLALDDDDDVRENDVLLLYLHSVTLARALSQQRQTILSLSVTLRGDHMYLSRNIKHKNMLKKSYFRVPIECS